MFWWIMQSTHSSSAQSGARQGRPSVRQWVLSSLLIRWSLWCSSLNGFGRSSSHSSHLWWGRGSSMGVGRWTTGRASRHCIGACTRGPASRVDLAVRVVGTRPRRVLYNVYKRFCHFSSSQKKKKNVHKLDIL